MTEAVKMRSVAQLRHEYRTPVNHIMGYSELLIEEAGERHLEAFIPVFLRIREGGRELLELIRSAFGEDADPATDATSVAFQANLGAWALEISRILTSLRKDPGFSDRAALADLNVISGAIRRLLELPSC